MSEQDMQPPAGHPMPEHGKGGGTCPFAGLIAGMSTQSDSALLKEQLRITKEYGDFLSKINSIEEPRTTLFNARGFKATPSFAPHGRDTHPAQPGMEQIAHVIHSNLRVMVGKIGSCLDVEALESCDETRELADHIRRFNAATEAHLKLAKALYKRAHEIEDEQSPKPNRKRNPNIYDGSWCAALLPPDELQSYKDQFAAITADMEREYKAAIQGLENAAELPITTGTNRDKTTNWVQNNHLNNGKKFGPLIWQLKLFSEGQDDRALRSAIAGIEKGNSYVLKDIEFGTSQTTDLLNKTTASVLERLFEIAPAAALKLIADCNSTIAKGLGKERETILYFYLYDAPLQEARSSSLTKLLSYIGAPLSAHDGLSPKVASSLIGNIIHSKPVNYPYDHVGTQLLMRDLADSTEKDPRETARIIQSNPAHVETVRTLRDILAAKEMNQTIAYALLNTMLDPRSLTRVPATVEAAR
ncbi:MAG: hypothetical protein SFT92_02015 [Rickettsiales bacterium]|nr:hypothetical protein [Rickettsiales bacterium]